MLNEPGYGLYGLEKLIEKINELNKNTKPKNKLGF